MQTLESKSTDKDNIQDEIQSESPRYIVGIGASAGGLEALQSFFAATPIDSGLAFVVVQHLSPDHKSLMAELLSRHTKMPVKVAEHNQRVLPDCVYLIPPRNNMTIKDGRLHLESHDPRQGLSFPIDLFLHSLGEDQGERSIGIILSGTGSDGSRGIRSIKESGGTIFVQSEGSARFSGMPGSAISTGLADYVLDSEKMPAEIIKYASHPLAPRTRSPHAHLIAGATTMENLTTLMRKETGLDFSCYKPATVLRRIERRMTIAQLNDLDDYVDYLRHSANEVQMLAKDLLISVTKFFRDSTAFTILRDRVIPEIATQPRQEPILRAWTVGCATGEEPYSISILLREHIRMAGLSLDFKVFATDVDRNALNIAGAGIYPQNIATDMPTDILERYFSLRENQYHINRDIRDRVVFAPQNILKDPPFTRVNLISCRNLLIYFQPAAQKRVLSLFHFALQPGGFLFLGSSESVGDLQEGFETVDAKNRIYRKRDIGQRLLTPNSAISLEVGGGRLERPLMISAPERRDALRESLLSYAGDHLAKFSNVAGFLLSVRMELLHTFGTPPDYISLPKGWVSLDFCKMLPRDLSLAVSTAAGSAIRERRQVRYTTVRFVYNEQTREANVLIELLGDREITGLLVLLESGAIDASKPAESYSPDQESLRRITDLEREVQATKENLQAAIEELEAANEELQASNEELLASNEELQSTNEELESVNEELYTVNAEHQSKIHELTVANDDLENFIQNTDIGTIFLDSDLRIRRFTPAITREINLLPHDIGRPVTDLSHPIIQEAITFLPQVAAKGESVEKVLQTPNGTFFLVGVLPYRSGTSDANGLVITLVNVSPLKQAEESVRRSEQTLATILEMVDLGICLTDENGLFVRVNAAYRQIYGYETEKELIGKHFSLVVPPKDREAAEKLYRDFMKTGDKMPSIWEVVRKDGEHIRIEVRAGLVQGPDGEKWKLTVIRKIEESNTEPQSCFNCRFRAKKLNLDDHKTD